MIQESCIDPLMGIGEKVSCNIVPEPENNGKKITEIRESFVKTVNFIQTVAERKGKRFLSSDNVRK